MNWLKSTILSLAVAISSLSVSRADDILVTNFGTAAATDDPWTYTAGSSSLVGLENTGFLLYLNGSMPNTDFTGITGIEVTANVTTAPVNGFTVLLLDAADRSVTGVFDWQNFVGGASVTATLSNITPGFDYANVVNWNLVGGGSATNLSVVLGSINGVTPTVVPEPSTYASIAGILVLGFVAVRRRKV